MSPKDINEQFQSEIKSYISDGQEDDFKYSENKSNLVSKDNI